MILGKPKKRLKVGKVSTIKWIIIRLRGKRADLKWKLYHKTIPPIHDIIYAKWMYELFDYEYLPGLGEDCLRSFMVSLPKNEQKKIKFKYWYNIEFWKTRMYKMIQRKIEKIPQ